MPSESARADWVKSAARGRTACVAKVLSLTMVFSRHGMKDKKRKENKNTPGKGFARITTDERRK